MTKDSSFDCSICGKSGFSSQEALDAHVKNPGFKHNGLVTSLRCDKCNRTNFVSQQALDSHMENPGKQHTGRRAPCNCDSPTYKILEVKRKNDGFIYKAVFRCLSCGKGPITIPQAQDEDLRNRLSGLTI